MSDLFDDLDRLAEAGELEQLEVAALKALKGADPNDEPDLWLYIAWARLEMGRYEEALDAAQESDDPLYEAKALFHMWEFSAAWEVLEAIEEYGDNEAEVEWYRGLIAEFTGGDPRAHYRRSAALDPVSFLEPVHLTEKEVDSVVNAALDALPKEISRVAREAVIAVSRIPKQHHDVDPLSLGLYTGINALEKSHDGPPALPPRIEIYQGNIERFAATREEAIEELRITLLHEIGHHLGYDEEGLARLNLD